MSSGLLPRPKLPVASPLVTPSPSHSQTSNSSPQTSSPVSSPSSSSSEEVFGEGGLLPLTCVFVGLQNCGCKESHGRAGSALLFRGCPLVNVCAKLTLRERADCDTRVAARCSCCAGVSRVVEKATFTATARASRETTMSGMPTPSERDVSTHAHLVCKLVLPRQQVDQAAKRHVIRRQLQDEAVQQRPLDDESAAPHAAARLASVAPPTSRPRTANRSEPCGRSGSLSAPAHSPATEAEAPWTLRLFTPGRRISPPRHRSCPSGIASSARVALARLSTACTAEALFLFITSSGRRTPLFRFAG